MKCERSETQERKLLFLKVEKNGKRHRKTNMTIEKETSNRRRKISRREISAKKKRTHCWRPACCVLRCDGPGSSDRGLYGSPQHHDHGDAHASPDLVYLRTNLCGRGTGGPPPWVAAGYPPLEHGCRSRHSHRLAAAVAGAQSRAVAAGSCIALLTTHGRQICRSVTAASSIKEFTAQRPIESAVPVQCPQSPDYHPACVGQCASLIHSCSTHALQQFSQQNCSELCQLWAPWRRNQRLPQSSPFVFFGHPATRATPCATTFRPVVEQPAPCSRPCRSWPCLPSPAADPAGQAPSLWSPKVPTRTHTAKAFGGRSSLQSQRLNPCRTN